MWFQMTVNKIIVLLSKYQKQSTFTNLTKNRNTILKVPVDEEIFCWIIVIKFLPKANIGIFTVKDNQNMP